MATIIVGTNSYVTEAELQTYADDRGIVIQGADLSVLLINAMDYIETRSYSGQKFDADQSLEFPRYYTEPHQIPHQMCLTISRMLR